MSKMKITAGGDALMVKTFPKEYTGLDEIREFLTDGDFSLVNIETIISDYDCFPSAYSGGTWVNARPEVLKDILKYGFNICGASNNHSMDYSYDGLRSTIRNFKENNVAYCGIGESLEEAGKPAVKTDAKGNKLAVISVSATFDNASRAGYSCDDLPSRPGQNFLRHSTVYQVTPAQLKVLKEIEEKTYMNGHRNACVKMGFYQDDGNFYFGGLKFIEGETEKKITKCNSDDLKRICDTIKKAKEENDAVIVMYHHHEILRDLYTEPDEFSIEFCHACIDAGASAIIGGGTHQIQPVEIYKDCPVFYSLGDFAFQNNSVEILPPDFKIQYGLTPKDSTIDAINARSLNGKRGLTTDIANYLTFLPEIEITEGKVSDIGMLPLELGFFKNEELKGYPFKADKETSEKICSHLNEISKNFGTELFYDGKLIKIK